MLHVEIARGFEPVLVHLDRQRPHLPQTALGVGKDAHDMGAALQLLVQASSMLVDFMCLWCGALGLTNMAQPLLRVRRISHDRSGSGTRSTGRASSRSFLASLQELARSPASAGTADGI
jgi:hypothetical protein